MPAEASRVQRPVVGVTASSNGSRNRFSREKRWSAAAWTTPVSGDSSW
nr:hypothetical protein [Kibdelosporangium sp. MJ126-NF4]